MSLSAYKSWFTDYIVLEATGTEEDGLPAYRYTQTGARYQGLSACLS